MSVEQAQVVVTAQTPSLWSSIREALRGSHQDFTSGNLNRAILLLAIPMVLEMVLESLFAVVDVFWVGRLGADAVATVGLTESMLSLVMAIGFGLSLSTTAMVARRIGEKEPAAAAVAGVQAIVIGLVFSAAVGIPCLFYAPNLLRLMGASPRIVAVGSGYARIALGGGGVIMMLFLNNAIFRGAGDAAIAMRLLWVSNIINLILDPCLIFGWGPFPKLGVTGAALATFSGRSIGVLYQFYRLLRGTERIRILRSQLRVNFDVLIRLLRVSLTGILQRFWLCGAGWLHHCHPHSHLRFDAQLGAQQRGGHARGTESRRPATRASRNIRLAHRPLQYDFSRGHRNLLHLLCRAGHPSVHPRCGRRSSGGKLLAHPELRQHWVRLWHGDAASL